MRLIFNSILPFIILILINYDRNNHFQRNSRWIHSNIIHSFDVVILSK